MAVDTAPIERQRLRSDSSIEDEGRQRLRSDSSEVAWSKRGRSYSTESAKAKHGSWGVSDELQVIGGLVMPIVASTFLQVFMGIVDTIIVGHLGRQELAASALGNMWFNCLWFITFGALSAMDTLISQLYGAKKHREIKAVVLRGAFVGSVLTVFMAVGLMYGEQVMVSILGVDIEVAEMVGVYDRGLVLGLWPFTIFTVLQKYLQAVNEPQVSVHVSALANVFNAVVGYLLVYRTPLGFTGAPLATSLSRIFMCGYLLVHVSLPKEDGTSHDLLNVSAKFLWSRRGFSEFLRLAIPGAFMMSLEAWAFDATTLMASLLHDTTVLSAHTAALNLSGLAYYAFPFGVGIACSIRVGNLLGAGRGNHARLSFLLSMALACVSMLVVAVLFVVFASHIGYIFTQDPLVVHCLAGIMPILALYLVLDGFQGVAAGAMRGMGRQRAAAALNFLGFWLLGVPCGYILCFKAGMGIQGIWWGTCIGLFVLSIGQTAVLARNTDWDALSREVVERLHTPSPLSQPLMHGPTVSPPATPTATHSLRSVAKTPFLLDESVVMAPLLIIGAYSDQQETLKARAIGDWVLGTCFVFIVAMLWTGATVFKQIIFWNLNFDHPFFLSYVCNSCYMLNVPIFMIAKASGCMGPTGSDVVPPDSSDSPDSKLNFIERASPFRSAAYLGVMVAPLWFIAQWTYGAGVAATSVTSSTVISATSCAWTYVLSVAVLKEEFQWAKVAGLGFCILGNMTTMLGDTSSLRDGSNVSTMSGDVLCLISALLYASYSTIISKFVREDIPITVFFGVLGVALFVALSPAAWIYRESLASGLSWNLVGLMILNGLFDNVLSQFLWAKAVLLTSPTVATVGLSLTIPLAALSDILRGIDLSVWSFVSAALVITGFLAVNMGNSFDRE